MYSIAKLLQRSGRSRGSEVANKPNCLGETTKGNERIYYGDYKRRHQYDFANPHKYSTAMEYDPSMPVGKLYVSSNGEKIESDSRIKLENEEDKDVFNSIRRVRKI